MLTPAMERMTGVAACSRGGVEVSGWESDELDDLDPTIPRSSDEEGLTQDPAAPSSTEPEADSGLEDPPTLRLARRAGHTVHEVAADGEVVDIETDDDQGPRPLILADGRFDENRGFVDASGVLRLWIDQDGVIAKVWLLPAWRDRIAKDYSPLHASLALAAAFDQALAEVNQARRPTPEPINPFGEATEAGSIPLSWEEVARIAAEMEQVNAALAAIPPGTGEGITHGRPTVGLAANGNVGVELNAWGGYARVAFDPEWLRTSRVTRVCDAVPLAAAQAKHLYVPPEHEPGEVDRLRDRQRELNRELTAMVKRGFF